MMPLVLKVGFVGLWIGVLLLSGLVPPLSYLSGLFVPLLGGSALSLTAFTLEEAREALRQTAASRSTGADVRLAAVFWEATARNAWIAGVLGSLLSFVLALGHAGSPVGNILTRLAFAFVPAIYGMALAGVCSVPAVKVRQRMLGGAAGSPALPEGAGSRWERALGWALFVALVGWTLWAQYRTPPSRALLPWSLVVHWPAVLVVLGAALGLRVLAGGRLARQVSPSVFAGAGTLGCLIGVVSVILAVAEPDLPRLTVAVSFILTASFVALLAMALIANPAEDRRVLEGEAGDYSWASRAAWLIFPLAALIFLFIAFLVVSTPFPMKK
jgi:hypothetical protein